MLSVADLQVSVQQQNHTETILEDGASSVSVSAPKVSVPSSGHHYSFSLDLCSLGCLKLKHSISATLRWDFSLFQVWTLDNIRKLRLGQGLEWVCAHMHQTSGNGQRASIFSVLGFFSPHLFILRLQVEAKTLKYTEKRVIFFFTHTAPQVELRKCSGQQCTGAFWYIGIHLKLETDTKYLMQNGNLSLFYFPQSTALVRVNSKVCIRSENILVLQQNIQRNMNVNCTLFG